MDRISPSGTEREILLIGGFPPPIGGETVKNEILKDALQKLGYQIRTLDSSNWKKKKIKVSFRVLLSTLKSNFIIISVSYIGLTILLPFLLILSKVFRKRICILVIGGKLAEYISERSTLYKMVCISSLKSVDAVVTETYGLKEQLEALGLLNVVRLPNFKRTPSIYCPHASEHNELRLVFVSRVVESKGVYDAIEGCKTSNKRAGRIIAVLDIYGPADKKTVKGLKNIEGIYSYIKYKGSLSPEEVISVICNYDVMLFPTHYSGEGFPGVLIDAMFAGVPVIASDWRYNSEIIKDAYNGYLVPIKSPNYIAEKILYIYNNRNVLEKMRENCFKESPKYYADRVIAELIDILRKKGWSI